jgi:hypothetical protein
MSALLKLLLLCVAGIIVLPVAALLLNRLPLSDPPGVWPRLQTYLTTNIAELKRDSRFPELRARVYPVSPDRLFDAAVRAARALGWRPVNADPESRVIRAVATTRLWRFKDDLEIRVLREAPGSRSPGAGASLRVRSESTFGRGDLGANERHILNLLQAVDTALSEG